MQDILGRYPRENLANDVVPSHFALDVRQCALAEGLDIKLDTVHQRHVRGNKIKKVPLS